MQNFQGIIFIGMQIYREIFKSTLKATFISQKKKALHYKLTF